jgi:hypothetical protein
VLWHASIETALATWGWHSTERQAHHVVGQKRAMQHAGTAQRPGRDVQHKACWELWESWWVAQLVHVRWGLVPAVARKSA